MSRLSKFLALPSVQRALLIRTWIELFRARVGLTVLPFTWHAARIVCTQPGIIRDSKISAETIAWAINIAARYVPRATCLTQALAAKRLLNAAGISSEVRFACGVDTKGGAGAHAWVECAGLPLLGSAAPQEMVVLPPLMS